MIALRVGIFCSLFGRPTSTAKVEVTGPASPQASARRRRFIAVVASKIIPPSEKLDEMVVADVRV